MVRFALLLLAAMPLAQAQTYKWVDARGVVNYSNTPPPQAAKAQPVEERISVYASEPAAQSAAIDRRLAALDAEWLQRQRLMAYAAAAGPAAPVYDDYRMGSYYAPYFLPAVAHRRPVLYGPATVVRPVARTQRASAPLDLRR